jgi:hypothetical protein
MKSVLIKSIVIAAICFTACVDISAQQLADSPLTNASVVKLVRAGFKDKTVIAIIHSRPGRFDLDTDKLIELKRNGVSENIILAMLEQDDLFVLGDDAWSNDSGFGAPARRSREKDPQGRSGDSDIFGGSQGSSGETRGRGMRGSNQGETTTTGSATVRILRPQSESDSASLKLEKIPTLNNESVIRLVEAGFSEGTIIKRIEDSPADFDLSKIDELRKRRVSEGIIAAMTAAMSDESDPKQSAPAKTKSK